MDRPDLAIGIYPDAHNSLEWTRIRSFLEPAAKLGGIDIENGPGWTVWTVHRGSELIAAANVRRTTEDEAEVTLIGGTDCRDWLRQLDTLIGQWAKQEGCTKLVAAGRAGWTKLLGWSIVGSEGKMVAYERGLV